MVIDSKIFDSMLADPAVRLYVGRVDDVVVSGDNRGKGIGRQLVEHVIDQARSLGIGQLQLL